MTESESDTKTEAEPEWTGTFLIIVADEESAVLKDIRSGQVHALLSSPGISEDEAVRGTVAPDPPMNISWQLVEVESRRTVSVERSTESPTMNSRDIAADSPDGELIREERTGASEIHVLSIPDGMIKQVIDNVLDDREGLLSRAARLDVSRVKIHSQPGVVTVRYMP